MILIALGSNLPAPGMASPRETVEAALRALEYQGMEVTGRSSLYRTVPFPPSDQPRFVNAVVSVATLHGPEAVLSRLHGIEEAFGRVRRTPNEARTLDLDLIAYGDRVRTTAPILPHPRLEQRNFVLRPLRDVNPDWQHPVSGRSVAELLEAVGHRDIEPIS